MSQDVRRGGSPLPPVLAVRSVTKRFGRLAALSDVSIDFAPGEVHAVLGENGAGKSTLMNLLSGSLVPDQGDVLLDGSPVRFESLRDARRAGIGMVHQHFTLIDALTVGENLALSFQDDRWRYLPSHVKAAAEKFAEEVGLSLADVDARAGDLPVGARQRLEILKALAGAGRVLILDEPTAVLTPRETDQLFVILRRLKSEGRAILFITHKLPEALSVADHITILRRGEVAGSFAAHEVDEPELARRMVGTLPPLRRTGSSVESSGPAILELCDVVRREPDGRPSLDGLSLRLVRGEILGIAGVDGNGQSELFEVLSGLRAPSQGTLKLDGRELPKPTPRALLEAGVGRIPPDRQRDGLVLGMSVLENCALNHVILSRHASHGLLDYDGLRELADGIVREYVVKLASIDAPVRSLSGGNQQRVIIGRELSQQPRLLVAVNPTRGLDMAATRSVGEALQRTAARGCSIVLISTDLDEVLTLSHTIRVLFRGRLSVPLQPPVDVEQLGLLMAGVDA